MRRMLSLSRLCIVFGLVASMWPGPVTAQLAPTGGHYAGRACDTGHQPGIVNASGGYGASVPLELPAARGGLPVPLHISFGARGVGAAGLGWDVPLSYVRRDLSFAGRRPALRVDQTPQGREQVLLSLQGQTHRHGPQGIGAGSRSTTRPSLSCASKTARGCSSMEKDVQLSLRCATGARRDGRLALELVDGPGRHDGAARVRDHHAGSHRRQRPVHRPRSHPYNTHPDTGCAKHEVGSRLRRRRRRHPSRCRFSETACSRACVR